MIIDMQICVWRGRVGGGGGGGGVGCVCVCVRSKWARLVEFQLQEQDIYHSPEQLVHHDN